MTCWKELQLVITLVAKSAALAAGPQQWLVTLMTINIDSALVATVNDDHDAGGGSDAAALAGTMVPAGDRPSQVGRHFTYRRSRNLPEGSDSQPCTPIKDVRCKKIPYTIYIYYIRYIIYSI